jgi:DNA topoisomerase-3
LLKREYVIRKDKQIIPTEKGIGVIKILPDADSIKSPILTAQWETDLKGVENGEISATSFMVAVTEYVKKAVAENNTIPEDKKALFASSSPNNNRGEILGKCPRCSNDITIIPNAKGKVPNYSCTNRECKFALFKDSKFFTAKKKELTKEIAIALISKGRIFISGLYSAEKGKIYNATVILNYAGEGYPSYSMEY